MGSPAIFKGSRTQLLTSSGLLLVNGADTRIEVGTVDPSSVATLGGAGSLYLNTSTGAVYIKQDAGTTTNWTQIPLGAANRTVNSFTVGTQAITTAHDLILCNATGGTVHLDLPTAVGNTGKTFTVVKTDSTTNRVEIDPNSTQTIGLQTLMTYREQLDTVTFSSDGSNWVITGADVEQHYVELYDTDGITTDNVNFASGTQVGTNLTSGNDSSGDFLTTSVDGRFRLYAGVKFSTNVITTQIGINTATRSVGHSLGRTTYPAQNSNTSNNYWVYLQSHPIDLSAGDVARLIIDNGQYANRTGTTEWYFKMVQETRASNSLE